MEILKDEAIILKKMNVNETNVVITMLTKMYGKINAIVYGVRSSNKKEKISLNPTSIIDIEVNKKNNDYVLKDYVMKKAYLSIYKNIEKLELSLYVVYVLNKIIEYNIEEEKIYSKSVEILEYIDKLNVEEVQKENFISYMIVIFLRRMMIEFGIFDKKQLEDKDFVLFNSKYIRDKNIKIMDFYPLVKKYEMYINEYLSIDIDYNQILVRR